MSGHSGSVHSDRATEDPNAASSGEPEDVRDAEHGNPLFVTDGEPSSPSPLPFDRRYSGSRELRSNRSSGVEVHVPPVKQRWTYKSFPDEWKVERVVRKVGTSADSIITYDVEIADGGRDTLTFSNLLLHRNGQEALDFFNASAARQSVPRRPASPDHSINEIMSVRTRRTNQQTASGFVNSGTMVLSSDDELSVEHQTRGRSGRLTRGSRLNKSSNQKSVDHSSDSSRETSPDRANTVKETRFTRSRVTRSKGVQEFRQLSYKEDGGVEYSSAIGDEPSLDFDSDESLPMIFSDIHGPPKRKRGNRSKIPANGAKKRRIIFKDKDRSSEPGGTRRSGRATKSVGNMRERGEDDIWADEEEGTIATPRAVGAREQFKKLPRTDAFRLLHRSQCDTCGEYGDNSTKGMLVYCQGCVVSYHKNCLGYRSGRDHLVTKVGDEDFVLQCRRCVGTATKRDATAPSLSMCQVCKAQGHSCPAFREKKTSRQEEKDREENGGQDPIIDIDKKLINNEKNVLFRCAFCSRAFHFEHLSSRADDNEMDEGGDDIAEQRFRQYNRDWKCLECLTIPSKVQGLVAWRPVDEEKYIPGYTVDMVGEDEKEYLVKWEGLSHFRCEWLPGAWVWGVTGASMRIAFARKNNSHNLPIMTKEDAIPEEFLRVDIVFDVQYTSYVGIRTEQVDKARIMEVSKALVKYKGLGYEDSVWEEPPRPEDGERWADFAIAYEDWVMSAYIHLPKSKPLEKRIERARSMDFQKDLIMKAQPSILTGGDMMAYQMEGLNWLYYKWYKGHSAILADEMGLGKTIQIIALLATLVEEHQCWPFLVVVPNSTCPNWRREIKKWAPSLRVVTFFGVSHTREMAMKYELLPGKDKDLRCHIVVTSYETPLDDTSKRFFKSISWAGLVVDEGQRLKNEKNLLYEALESFNIPFKILLTGTPLQNNARELFNLLHFVDNGLNAAELDKEYAELTKDNVPKLHELIRPFFLRRTKAQVLTFLPPMAEIIVPVTMSVVQRKLYRSILEKNPELIRSIFKRDGNSLKPTEKTNLNNILMQLRKCLCHPFVYNREIEERSVDQAISHRNLVDASAKLKLLEIMLPKLQERGHRVLIFSQFLAMLDICEDFLEGLDMPYERLDGNIGSLQKQKRIDAFNAENSPLFAFLLSTRAGGVGINLATADTVIILDPDFNPHQDIQALSRAHRIGQTKKVLVFHIMTRNTAEEKIMQVGKKKMSLDHVIINTMGEEEAETVDVESILKFGAAAIFDDSSTEGDIRYDSASVDLLLDRSQAEDTRTGEDKTAETQFSFARVWANDSGRLEERLPESESDPRAPDPSIWDEILKRRERAAAKEAAEKQETLGRGRRKKQTVNYSRRELELEIEGLDVDGSSPPRQRKESASDTDFQAKDNSDGDGEDSDVALAGLPNGDGEVDERELAALGGQNGGISCEKRLLRSLGWGVKIAPFRRRQMPILDYDAGPTEPGQERCVLCGTYHDVGSCPLKLAGVEHCGLCGLAHYAGPEYCPHLQSETQVRLMLTALKQSMEDRVLVDLAKDLLKKRKATLVRRKKEKVKKKLTAEERGMAGNAQYVGMMISQSNGSDMANGNVVTYSSPGPNGPHAIEGHGIPYTRQDVVPG